MANHVFIVGPTASGKSELALRVAEHLGAEICSMDAFQIYRGLDIGTGKITAGDRKGIPHHLMDLADPLAAFSVADFLQAAREIIVKSKAKPLVWVGGTGLYFRALREGLSPVPASDPKVIEEIEKRPLDELQKEIRHLDPAWAEQADLHNPRRIIRALAVFQQTRTPLSEWQKIKGEGLIREGQAVFIHPSAPHLKTSIAKRVQEMWKKGWVQEVENLLKIPGWSESQSAKAIGYGQVAAYLLGKISGDECRESILVKTGQYAKRQLTWFRSEQGLNLLDPEDGLKAILQIIDKEPK